MSTSQKLKNKLGWKLTICDVSATSFIPFFVSFLVKILRVQTLFQNFFFLLMFSCLCCNISLSLSLSLSFSKYIFSLCFSFHHWHSWNISYFQFYTIFLKSIVQNCVKLTEHNKVKSLIQSKTDIFVKIFLRKHCKLF